MQNLLIRDSQGADVAKLRVELARQLGGDAADFPGLAKGDVLDADCEAAIRRWQSGVGLIADGVIGPLCQSLLGLRKPPALEIPLSFEAVRQLFPATKPANVARYLPYVEAALGATDLCDRPMILAALGTVRAESEGFVPIAEMPSRFNTPPGGAPFATYALGTRIGKMLGNTDAGDGPLFKGRGFVQLTGRANYTAYGKQLGIDLASKPDLANAPEVAALLLAAFLAQHAKATRAALVQGNLAAARKLVNGGSHGLERYTSVFELAKAVLPERAIAALPAGAAGRKAGKKAAKATVAAAKAPANRRRSLTVRKDPADLRDRPYVPPPISLVAEFPPQAEMKRFLPVYSKAGLILDQGQQGACTGFGLACVVNYLRWRKAGVPAKLESVSAAMFYNFARRYDEYAGEDYEGSSCRGALKGWFNHGVCLEDDWVSEPPSAKPRYGYAQRATQTTLGVYLRIDLGAITDLQAAIQEVGAVYVSAFTHGGWDDVPSRVKPPADHAALPVIPWDGRPSKRDGHAFALVGFNNRGFIVQNSWGVGFGIGGFAVLSYGDWLANGMDAWAVAIGVPGVVVGRVGSAIGGTAKIAGGGADTRNWWSEDQAYRHSAVFGNDGRIERYLTEDEPNRSLLHQVAGLPDQWFRTQAKGAKKRLVIYAHGGLNSEADAIKRARALGRYLIGNDCYPLFLIWKTGLLESIGDIVSDAFRKQPPLAGASLGEMISERTDLLIEKTIGRPLARPIWSEMKENAELAFGSGRGGDLLITALQKLADTWGDDLELHFMGHSAGSIILGHLLSAMAARRLAGRVASIHLYAPACTVQFANRHYTPHVELMKRLYLHVLADTQERDDNVAAIYRKSLLYFVSNALEIDLRTPILGLQNVFDPDYVGWDGTSSVGETLKNWRDAAADAGLTEPERLMLVRDAKVLAAKPDVRIRAGHGSFDNDITVIGRTLERILGGPLLLPVEDLRGF